MEVSEYLSFASREPMQPWTRTAVMLRLASLRVFVLLVVFPLQVFSQASHLAPTLSRTAPAREFLAGLGTRAGMLGDESGTFEAWVYPLKLLRDFHLYFRTGSQVIPAESLARTVTVRPESWTISYAAETFRARETLLVPVNEPGAIITIEFETAEPLEAAVSFMPDLTLEWPGSLSGTASNWDSNLSAFYLSENENRFAAFVGSPTGLLQTENLWVSDAAPNTRSFSLGYIQKGQSFKTVVIAGSTNGRDEAEKTFRRLASDGSRLQTESADFYRDYLAKTVNLELPDPQLQQACDWSRISLIQGVVNNPFVGKSLVAGYGVSGAGNRPGFAWFFGRDSLWSALALDAEGDWSTTRLILEFLARYQRADGKIPHEVSQSASFVSWFEKYPYPFASADATPLYLIAMNDYVTHSGDVAFAKEKWDSIWKAYQFLESTIDASGLPSNSNAGHGWIEQGPLLPVQTELYQAGLGVEAIHELAALARLVDKAKASEKLDSEFNDKRSLLNKVF